MIRFIFCVLMLTGSCLANLVYLDYIKNIQSQIDETVEPCENFGKYACGKLIPQEKYNMFRQMSDLLDKQINNNYQPKTDDEKLIRKLYLSCKNDHDITKIMEQIDVLKSVKTWPVNRDFSDHEIAKLIAYLGTIDTGFLSMDIDLVGQDNIIFINLETSRINGNKYLSDTLQKFGVNTDERKKVIRNIENFSQQLYDIKSDKINVEDDKLNDVAGLKNAVPNFDWDTYFTTIREVFGLDKNYFMKKLVQIVDLRKLQNIANIIKATNSRTVANYIIWRYLSFPYDENCFNFSTFLYPLTVIQNNKEQHKKLYLKETNIFNHFEKTFTELKSQIKNSESNRLKTFMKIKRNIYRNYEQYLTGKFISDQYKDIDINENTFYRNVVNGIHLDLKNNIAGGENRNLLGLGDFIMSPVTKYILTDEHQKTSLHNFVTVNTAFWMEAIKKDNIYENKINDYCLPFEKEFDNDRNIYYITQHSAYHLSIQDYLHFINEYGEQFQKQTDILTEAGLNHAKAYMLALAQKKCRNGYETNKLHDNDNLLWFFKHSKHFSDTWGCKAKDPMYKVCDDSSFLPNLKN